jgi:hypothetical protein
MFCTSILCRIFKQQPAEPIMKEKIRSLFIITAINQQHRWTQQASSMKGFLQNQGAQAATGTNAGANIVRTVSMPIGSYS